MLPQQQQSAEPCDQKSYESEKGEPVPSPAQARPADFDAPDGGWGWVVLVATIIVLALTLAFPSCMGIFYTDLQTEFVATNSETSWVPSIMTAVLHAGGPLCSVLVERFGCRATVMLGGVLSGLGMAASSFTHSIIELYITAGVITGLGFCLSFQPAVTILGFYFVRHRAFVNAMSSTGTALGLSTLPFLSHYLHSKLGWRGSFLVLGAILLNCCVCGAVMRPLGPPRSRRLNNGPAPPREQGLKGRMRTLWRSFGSSVRRHMAFDLFCTNQRFRVYALGITWMMLGFVVPLVFIVPYATENGIEQSRAALLLAILGFINIFVRPLAGVLFSQPWFEGRHVYVFSIALLLNGLSNSICCISASFSVLLLYILSYGLSMSMVGSLLFTVLMDFVEMNRFASALGLLSTMESVTFLIGPPLAGYLIDSTKVYTYVFVASTITVTLSALFLLVSFYWLDHCDGRQKTSSPAPEASSLPKTIQASDCQPIKVSAGGKDRLPVVETERVTSV